MTTALQIDLTLDQIRSLIRQLPIQEQKELGKELAVMEYLSSPPCQFTTDELLSEVETALNEAEQGLGCTQKELRKKIMQR